MSKTVIRERYKVTRTFVDTDEYKLLEVVDIQDREMPSLIMNIYGSETMHRYAVVYDNLPRDDCRAYRTRFLYKGSLAVVFEDCKGSPLWKAVGSKKKWEWRRRIEIAELLLHTALTQKNIPPLVSCAAFSRDNVIYDDKSQRLGLRYAISPMMDANEQLLISLVYEEVNLVLERKLRNADAQVEFLKKLEKGKYKNVVGLYSDWRRVREEIISEQEEFEKKLWSGKLFCMVRRAIRRKKREKRDKCE